MQVNIAQDVTQLLPDASLGVIFYKDSHVTPSPKLLQGRINYFVELLRLEHDRTGISEITSIQNWRTAFKKVGIDPSRYRPSAESLIRRLLQGNPFFWINSAVDVNNFLSIYHALPYGIYDADKLHGPIVFRIGTSADHYIGLNGREMNMNGKLLLADATGAFGSPIVDSQRTAVTEETKNFMQIIYVPQVPSPPTSEEIIGSTVQMFTEINGGEVVSQTWVTG
ncbi:B3/4 domain-containing protein [Brevibacillus fulvus]|uniref:DNA/RNA-binding domain of Phe-tRNA-synthetase-like protein n=1 Tax=Brevibacillus fulvus TaxID=1125967 RepID=A0A938XZL1_9BACL|nr:phenylalanine--tRNA ligase beta subunit-related protein [Brevibacillus fulvus]MBM7591144.1 DNA/RNA-binding domain of Phe-tRNA-synthetase-like protein [Brevibacillus fulvus]